MPTVLPDYDSEENWNEFLQFFPQTEQDVAPTYGEAAKNLEKFEAAAAKSELQVVRMKVQAEAWAEWAKANNMPLSQKTVGMYAAYLHAEQALGKSPKIVGGDSTTGES